MFAPDQIPLCLDGRMLEEQGTGVATYARGLRATLEQVANTPPFIIVDRQGAGITATARDRSRAERWRRWVAVRLDRSVRLRRLASALIARDVFRRAQHHFRKHGTALRVQAPDQPFGIVHWTYPVPIVLEGWINVYTVHDAIPFTHPELSPIDASRHCRLLAAIARHAAAIVTVSQHAAAAIADTGILGALPIVNCGQVVLPLSGLADVLPVSLTPNGYFLICGAVEPRKNIVRAEKAWRAAATGLPLVIAGPDGWRADEIVPLLRDPAIIRLPYLPPDMLAALQAGARALLFPSLAEGFGLPIAEAMTLGTPVMTSAGGATEETAGGAALLIDPTDVGAMADGIDRLAKDDAFRERLVVAGLHRSSDFSLVRHTEAISALHRSLVVRRDLRH